MTNLQQLKEEAMKEFDDYYYSDDFCRDDTVKKFLDSLVTKAYEEGKKHLIEGFDNKPIFRIWDKVVFDRQWFTKGKKEWLLYTTITMIDKFNNDIKYYYPHWELFIEWLRLATEQEIKDYFNY